MNTLLSDRSSILISNVSKIECKSHVRESFGIDTSANVGQDRSYHGGSAATIRKHRRPPSVCWNQIYMDVLP
jgi:hypothetical protein